MKGVFILNLLFFGYFGFCQTHESENENQEKYSNKLYTYDKEETVYTLLQLFKLQSSVCDSLELSIQNDETLKIQFKDIYGPCYELFKGKQKRKYFEIYLMRRRIYIPILYSKVNIIRIRMKYLENGDIEIQEYRNNSSNILFMASGGSSKNIYLLKK